jgi:hypothetical protein
VVICSHATLPELASVIKKCKKVSHAVAIPRYQKSKGSSKGAGVELEVKRPHTTHDTRPQSYISIYSFIITIIYCYRIITHAL